MKLKGIYEEWIVENGSYKLVAFFITLILWVSVLGRKETTTSKEVPLQFITSQDRIVTSNQVKSVVFDLSGSKRALKRFAVERVPPIRVDVADGELGRMIVAVPDDALKLPFGVKVVAIRPPSIVVDVEEVARKRVPVVVSWRNASESNAVMLNAKVQPSEIWLEGGKTSLSKIREILTAEVSSEEAVEVDGKKVIKAKLKFPDIDGIRPIGDVEVLISL